jgi:hypothetical protein
MKQQSKALNEMRINTKYSNTVNIKTYYIMLKVITQYSGGVKPLNDPRSDQFKNILTVQ